MKKVVLSSALILFFTAYALHVRIIGAGSPIVLIPDPTKDRTTLSLPKYDEAPTATPVVPTPVIPTPTTTTKPTTTPKPAITPTPTATPTPAPTPTPPPVANTGKYKNGSYTGPSVDAYYGSVQVKVVISGGEITDVQFLDYPQDRSTSKRINGRAMPYLISEAISIQDSKVDTVSGASFTSAAFKKSLASALSQAKV